MIHDPLPRIPQRDSENRATPRNRRASGPIGSTGRFSPHCKIKQQNDFARRSGSETASRNPRSRFRGEILAGGLKAPCASSAYGGRVAGGRRAERIETRSAKESLRTTKSQEVGAQSALKRVRSILRLNFSMSQEVGAQSALKPIGHAGMALWVQKSQEVGAQSALKP